MTPRKKVFLIAAGLVILIALYYVVPALLMIFVAQPLKVEGAAMSPTLNNGDRVFVSKSFAELNRGDVVTFRYPRDKSKSFIKRIVGLPGETISLDNDGHLYINGEPIIEPYLSAENNRNPRPMPEQTLDAGHYFMMGDNRDASHDSRSYGSIPREDIYGKFIWRYWPLGNQ